MNLIKQIIKESLLLEVGDASAKPYEWKQKKNPLENVVTYRFKTEGGSKLTIDMNFVLLQSYQITRAVDEIEDMKRSEKLFYINNPYYYWDTEFIIVKHKHKKVGGDKGHLTISDSKFKTEKTEIFRIMATISEIIKDFMDHNKVRGFAFRPASDSRSKMFIRYFQQQIPNVKVTELKTDYHTMPAIFVTVDDTVKHIKGEKGPYEDEFEEDKPSLRNKLKFKFGKSKPEAPTLNTHFDLGF